MHSPLKEPMMNRTKKLIAAGAGAVVAVAAGTGIAFAVTDDDDDLEGKTLDRATAAAIAHTGGGRVTDAEVDDDGVERYEVEVTMDDGREVDVHLDRSFRVLDTPYDDDRFDGTAGTDELPADEAERVGAAAIATTPGARVEDVDVDDDTGHYEVDVLLADGSRIDVTLDRSLQVLASVPDPIDTDADD
jgi:uncharacterized membrane protein YkoI